MFVVTCNEPYLRYLKPLLASIHLNHRAPVFFQGINISQGSKDELSRFPDLYIRLEQHTGDERLYCCHRRIKLLYELLQLSAENLIYVDVDSIVRNNLNDLVRFDGDIMCHQRNSRFKRRKLMSGVLVINNNLSSKSLLYNWNELCAYRNWYDDQISLYKCLSKYKYNVKQLPISAIDYKFNDNSLIWVGKGERKDSNRRYCAEATKYSDLYDKIIRQ